MLGLATAFFATAAVYASVGFAGGATYNALLVLASADHRTLPIVALVCNLIVAGGSSIRFARAGIVPWRRLTPLLALSIPAAFLGGAIPVSKDAFILLLGSCLLVAGVALLAQRAPREEAVGQGPALPAIAISGPLGLLAGIVGIGGGIFLAPILHLMAWDRTKAIAASASIFILANSVAGLMGQAGKMVRDGGGWSPVLAYWPLALAVLIGGQVGNRVGLDLLPPVWLRRATGVLILYVAARLLSQFLHVG